MTEKRLTPTEREEVRIIVDPMNELGRSSNLNPNEENIMAKKSKSQTPKTETTEAAEKAQTVKEAIKLNADQIGALNANLGVDLGFDIAPNFVNSETLDVKVGGADKYIKTLILNGVPEAQVQSLTIAALRRTNPNPKYQDESDAGKKWVLKRWRDKRNYVIAQIRAMIADPECDLEAMPTGYEKYSR